ncbi:MAG: hypothetical protein Q4G68_03015 [Planctomycetia bacterium]|nr:hypothetical protein [Planctomycetia bacterium]
MKKTFVLVLAMAIGTVVTGTVRGEEYGSSDYAGAAEASQSLVATEANNAEMVSSEASEQSGEYMEVNSQGSGAKWWGCCCWTRCCWRPVVVYPVVIYRPAVVVRRVTTYTTITRIRTCYAFRYITVFKGYSAKSASKESGGFLMQETPAAGTVLAQQGVCKGDIITHIDGVALTSPADIDRISETSNLTVLKAKTTTATTNATAFASESENTASSDSFYGAYEY